MIALVVLFSFMLRGYKYKREILPLVSMVLLSLDYFDVYFLNEYIDIKTYNYIPMMIANSYFIYKRIKKEMYDDKLFIQLHIISFVNLNHFQVVVASFLLAKNEMTTTTKALGSAFLSVFLIGSVGLIDEWAQHQTLVFLCFALVANNMFRVSNEILLLIVTSLYLITQAQDTYLCFMLFIIIILYELKISLKKKERMLSKNMILNHFKLRFVINRKRNSKSKCLKNKKQAKDENYRYNKNTTKNIFPIKNSIVLDTGIVFIIILVTILLLSGGQKWV